MLSGKGIASPGKSCQPPAMDDPRPKIFISTVTKELQSARKVVTDTLRRLHFEPVVQDEFPSHTGVVRAMLEKELEPCAAVIQIVGFRYGWDVYGAPDPTEVMSYTHYEALYAHRKPIPIWYLIATDEYEPDIPNDEDAEKRAMQAAYRVRLQRTGHLHHSVIDIRDVELAVFRMQDDLDKLRPPQFQQLLLLESSGGLQSESTPQPEATTADTIQIEKTMRALLSEFVPALQQAQQGASPEDDERKEQELYDRLANILEVTPDEARAQIQILAEKTKANPAEPLLARAKAAYALKKYAEAEQLALEAADEAAKSQPLDVSARIDALSQAAESAGEQIAYERALEFYRQALALTDARRDVIRWLDLQNDIGWMLYLKGEYGEMAALMGYVCQTCEQAGNSEHDAALRARDLRANGLSHLGRHLEAENELRAVLAIYERICGLEHQNALDVRNNLANILGEQDKHAEAEKEYRSVLAIRERDLGAEHPKTLSCRHNLAATMQHRGKHVEAEEEHRAVLAIRERTIGAEHPATLTTRMSIAYALRSQGRFVEAEKESLGVIADMERVLGTEHPDTLSARSNLALVFHSLDKHFEAEKEHRAVLAARESRLGPEHPFVFQSCFNLSLSLNNLGRKEEALDFARRSLVGSNNVLGKEHPHSKLAKKQVDRLEKP
jgi:tetratricopeptide (TPR) repeat protein